MADSLSWNSQDAAGRLAPLRLRRHLVGGRMSFGIATPSTTLCEAPCPWHALRAVVLSRPRLWLMEPPTALGLEVALQKLSLIGASLSRSGSRSSSTRWSASSWALSEWLCFGVRIRSALAYLELLWDPSVLVCVGGESSSSSSSSSSGRGSSRSSSRRSRGSRSSSSSSSRSSSSSSM